MTALTPGVLYVATVRGQANVRCLAHSDGTVCTSTVVGGYLNHQPDHVTDTRPLIVLDLNSWRPQSVAEIPKWLRGKAIDAPSESAVRALADQIEAQTKPARIPEPGLWGVVVSPDSRNAIARTWVNHDAYWCEPNGYKAAWGDLIDPVLIRDGITGGAA